MSSGYDNKAASEFWSKRLESTTPMAAVLSYDAPEVSNRAYDRWEIRSLKRELPKNLEGKEVLDIASGIGRIALTMARFGARVTALDISPAMLEHLQNEARRKKVSSRILTIEAPSDKLPLSSSSFDIVTCFGLLEHLPEAKRRKTMLEAFRVLRKNGKLFVVVNNSRCVFLAGRYRMKRQSSSGYFVTLVGLDWLQKVCKSHGMISKVVATNPNYTTACYVFRNVNVQSTRVRKVSAQIWTESVNCDLKMSGQSQLTTELASHFLVEIKSSG